ncbi:hypothetical protein D3C78_1182220 [compost metagenome]
MGGHGHAQVGRLQHGGVPGGDVFQAVVDAVVAHVADHFLGTGHGNRRLGGDFPGNAHHAVEQAGGVAVDTIDQADAARFVGTEGAPRISEFTQHAVPDDPGQALQCANIGGHADIDLLDGELRVLGRVTHVAGGNQVDGPAQAVALDRGEHGFAAIVHGVERGLQLQDLAPQQACIAPCVLAQLVGHACQHHQVDAGGKMLAGAAEHHHPCGIGVIDPFEDLDDFAPERGVHRIDLFRAIDLHMGNVVCKFHVERLVLRHGSDPLPAEKRLEL